MRKALLVAVSLNFIGLPASGMTSAKRQADCERALTAARVVRIERELDGQGFSHVSNSSVLVKDSPYLGKRIVFLAAKEGIEILQSDLDSLASLKSAEAEDVTAFRVKGELYYFVSTEFFSDARFITNAELKAPLPVAPRVSAPVQTLGKVNRFPLAIWTMKRRHEWVFDNPATTLSAQRPLALITLDGRVAWAVLNGEFFVRQNLENTLELVRREAGVGVAENTKQSLVDLRRDFARVQPLANTAMSGGPGGRRLDNLIKKGSVEVFAKRGAASDVSRRIVVFSLANYSYDEDVKKNLPPPPSEFVEGEEEEGFVEEAESPSPPKPRFRTRFPERAHPTITYYERSRHWIIDPEEFQRFVVRKFAHAPSSGFAFSSAEAAIDERELMYPQYRGLDLEVIGVRFRYSIHSDNEALIQVVEFREVNERDEKMFYSRYAKFNGFEDAVTMLSRPFIIGGQTKSSIYISATVQAKISLKHQIESAEFAHIFNQIKSVAPVSTRSRTSSGPTEKDYLARVRDGGANYNVVFAFGADGRVHLKTIYQTF